MNEMTLCTIQWSSSIHVSSSSDRFRESFDDARKDPLSNSFNPLLLDWGWMEDDSKLLERKWVDNDWREWHLLRCKICSLISIFDVKVVCSDNGLVGSLDTSTWVKIERCFPIMYFIFL